MPTPRKTVLALASLVALVLTAAVAAQDLPRRGWLHPELAAIDDAMAQAMIDNDIGAGLLGVMKDGEVVAQRSYGWTDFDGTQELQPDAIMRIASVSKPITAAAIRRLVSAKAIDLGHYVFDLGQPAGGILDIEPFEPPEGGFDPWLAEITVEHLLRHEGGWNRDECVIFDPDTQTYSLIDCDDDEDATKVGDLTRREIAIADEMNVPSPPTRAETARYILGQSLVEDGRGLVYEPGTVRAYSNEGYFFLGMIIEEVSGMSYLEYVHQSVLAFVGRDGCDVELGRTFAPDQDPREPWYDSDGLTGTNVYDPDGPSVEYAYGGWNHEARQGQGNIVTGTVPLLHFLDNYQVNNDSDSGDGIGVFLNEGPTARRSHGGNLSGTNAMAQQRGDGVHFAIILGKTGSVASAIRSAINDILDEGNIDWPTGDVELDCNGNGIPDGCDVTSGDSLDLDGNGIPDECEVIVNVTQQTYHPTIQDAINQSQWGDLIMVPPGTYDEGVAITQHPITLMSTLGPQFTTIDRSYAGGSVVVIEDVNATIEGFTISGGLAERGGGLHVIDARPVIRDCVFDGNITTGARSLDGGGGIYLDGSDATIESCAFVQNRTDDAQGGGAISGYASAPTITDCSFTSNESGVGGAIRLLYGAPGTLVLSGSTFESNQSHAYDAGAVYTYNVGYDVRDCTFAGNTSQQNGGASFHQTANGQATIYRRCVFDANVALRDGGALWTNSGTNALVELTDCTFVDNECGDDAPSGRNGGAIMILNSAVLTDCTFERNHSSAWAGAGRIQGGTIDIVRCSFEHNTAGDDHGALYLGTPGGSIRDCWFESNAAVGDNGAVFAPAAEVVRCVFRFNTAGRWAGALYAGTGGRVDSCAFIGNAAESGGAMLVIGSGLEVWNSLFARNDAWRGGAYWTSGNARDLIVNSTFVGNEATDDGGGLYAAGGEVTLHNSIVWSNTADGGEDGLSGAGTYFVEYSNVQDGVPPGEGNRSVDPRFVNEQGGNYRLDEGSPLIEVGDDDLVPIGLELDLDGTARFKDADGNGVATVDMGAYEADTGGCADLDGNGLVDFGDLLAVLAAWGNAGGPEDLDGSGTVDFGDILLVLEGWGPCA